MARRWRQRLLPPDSIANDLTGHKRLRYAPWFDPATELAVRNGWAVQYEEVDANLYRRGVERRRPRRGSGLHGGVPRQRQSLPGDLLGIYDTAARAAGRV